MTTAKSLRPNFYFLLDKEVLRVISCIFTSEDVKIQFFNTHTGNYGSITLGLDDPIIVPDISLKRDI